MFQQFINVVRDDTGQSLVEYALIIALVSIAAFTALTFLGTKVNNTLLAPASNEIP